MKMKKILTAGALVKEVIYTRAAGREPAKVRAAKRKASTEAQQLMNAKYSWQKLELMLAANFVPGDLVVTLTYDDDHLPADRAAANARLKKFRAELGRIRKDRGQELRMIWTTENKLGAGRWHHHIVVNSTGDDFAEISRLWDCGGDLEISRLQVDREKNYESLARYMCKEARERPGLRSWSYTRSCRHPEVEVFPVPDDTDITPPADAVVMEDVTKRTEYGEFRFVKYLAKDPQQLRRQRPRTRRKR